MARRHLNGVGLPIGRAGDRSTILVVGSGDEMMCMWAVDGFGLFDLPHIGCE
jgi:hypothetical protein